MKHLLLLVSGLFLWCTPLLWAEETEYGYLDITSSPSGAEVFLGERLVGKTPVKRYKLKTGIYVITIHRTGYRQKKDYNLCVRKGDNCLNYVLEAIKGTITGYIVTEGAKCLSGAEVRLRGMDTTQVAYSEKGNFEFWVPIGDYKGLFVTKSGFEELSIDRKMTVTDSLIVSLGTISLKLSKFMIESDPSGAEVLIDGDHKGKTPCSILGLTQGTHKLALKHKYCKSYEKVIDIHKDFALPLIGLESLQGVVEIGSIPSGIDIFMDDSLVGKTPCTLSNVEYGMHKFKLTQQYYLPHEEKIEVKRDTTVVSITLNRAFGKLTISTVPEGASLYIDLVDERHKCITPNTVDSIACGPHKLHIAKQDYEDTLITVNVDEAETAILSVALRPVVGTLSLEGSPRGALARIDNKVVGTFPLKTQDLTTGKHTIEISKAGYEKAKRETVIEAHKEHTLEMNLAPKRRNKAVLYSIMLPGKGQIYAGRGKTGWGIRLAGVICLGGIGYTQILYNEEWSEYKDALDYYNQANNRFEERERYPRAEEEYSELRDVWEKRQYALYATGAVYLLNIIDALLFTPHFEKLEIGFRADEGHIRLSRTF